jgi:hypothetical protein
MMRAICPAPLHIRRSFPAFSHVLGRPPLPPRGVHQTFKPMVRVLPRNQDPGRLASAQEGERIASPRRHDGMVIAPSSMTTMAGLRLGYANKLIVRAAGACPLQHAPIRRGTRRLYGRGRLLSLGA